MLNHNRQAILSEARRSEGDVGKPRVVYDGKSNTTIFKNKIPSSVGATTDGNQADDDAVDSELMQVDEGQTGVSQAPSPL